jgi:hypothetical protein
MPDKTRRQVLVGAAAATAGGAPILPALASQTEPVFASATTSSKSHTRSVRPASIAGVTRNVLWTRHQLYQTVYTASKIGAVVGTLLAIGALRQASRSQGAAASRAQRPQIGVYCLMAYGTLLGLFH